MKHKVSFLIDYDELQQIAKFEGQPFVKQQIKVAASQQDLVDFCNVLSALLGEKFLAILDNYKAKKGKSAWEIDFTHDYPIQLKLAIGEDWKKQIKEVLIANGIPALSVERFEFEPFKSKMGNGGNTEKNYYLFKLSDPNALCSVYMFRDRIRKFRMAKQDVKAGPEKKDTKDLNDTKKSPNSAQSVGFSNVGKELMSSGNPAVIPSKSVENGQETGTTKKKRKKKKANAKR